MQRGRSWTQTSLGRNRAAEEATHRRFLEGKEHDEYTTAFERLLARAEEDAMRRRTEKVTARGMFRDGNFERNESRLEG